VGYAFSAVTVPDGYTMHRNVIFGPNTDGLPARPFHAASGAALPATPLELWTSLSGTCGRSNTEACEAVTIPHNSNLSNGYSLGPWGTSQADIDLQRTYEVAAEIYQHKGSSECAYDAGEPECGFELYSGGIPVDPVGSYLRPMLGTGMVDAALGAADPTVNLVGNPVQLGFVGGTDGHNGAPGNVDESTWNGHDSSHDDTPEERVSEEDKVNYGPGGITGVWAPQNTREEIFLAIQRRETFATSGPRISVRVEQADSLGAACAFDPSTRVQMGGTFTAITTPYPYFLLQVEADRATQELPSGPGQADIASVQVVRVQADENGVLPATVTNVPMGPRGGCRVLQDDTFDPTLHTLWYVRVLQEETKRWSYDECLFDSSDEDREVLTADQRTWCDDAGGPYVQERAWSSPIWYEPAP
jgi:hypothetical protein